ncbi:C2H2-type domain-containing protein, partial [Trichostrongylus colubriformis]
MEESDKVQYYCFLRGCAEVPGATSYDILSIWEITCTSRLQSNAMFFRGSNDDNVVKKELPRKTESPIVCTVCNRLLLRSSRYSIRVTILAHFVKFHRNSPKDVEKYLASGSWDVASEFPYIDAVTSIKKGKLQCALCEAAFSDTCPLLKHATSVHESHKVKT